MNNVSITIDSNQSTVLESLRQKKKIEIGNIGFLGILYAEWTHKRTPEKLKMDIVLNRKGVKQIISIGRGKLHKEGNSTILKLSIWPGPLFLFIGIVATLMSFYACISAILKNGLNNNSGVFIMFVLMGLTAFLTILFIPTLFVKSTLIKRLPIELDPIYN
ncbi:hypothetical protein K6119_00495 [Paracrocinitomix mangrovi]|uniref:hypothetical protein n=1 Tax=Paracrocinitomix mangrovi TaxID=2862509 RepID=UPI001C8E4FD0|nr:hypothetical protein [Paracrocinitomix mangrovi]UKN01993.1 hypothetical protein K6119_00495 [Paracrocinitomix mangrovi]